MLSFFPTPYQGEVLYGIVARYHQQSGNSLSRQTLEELFGDRSAHSSVTLPTRLGTLAEQTAPFEISFDELLFGHTLSFNTGILRTLKPHPNHLYTRKRLTMVLVVKDDLGKHRQCVVDC